MKILKGVASAAVNFVGVGIVAPFAVTYLSPLISKYIALPPSFEIWEVLLLFGAVFAVTGFLQSGYSKGDFPWLFGKIGGGLAGIGFFYYLFLQLPSSVGSAGGVESSGLLLLVGLAIALSYGYMGFDFWDARRKNNATKAGRSGMAGATPPAPSGN